VIGRIPPLIGPHSYIQGLGGVRIGRHVGVGALMLTAVHAETPPGTPITDAPLRYGAIEVGDGCDIGSEPSCCPARGWRPGSRSGPAPLCAAGIRPAP
jgi:hypothetical protein